MDTLKVGPFTWRRYEGTDGCECWDLVVPEGVQLTMWSVKNYGGRPSERTGFSGWRLVSGGPFTGAGGWTSRDEAMRGVVPWLLRYYREQLQAKIAEAERMKVALIAFEKEIGVTR